MSWPGKLIRFCFYLLVILVPLVFLPNTSELFEFNKMIITYLLTTVIAGAWMTDMILQKKLIFRRTSLDWPILLFLLSNLISLFLSIDVRTSLLGYYSRFNGGLASLACYSLLYWVYVTYMDRKSTLNSIAYCLLPTACLVSLYGVLEHFGIDAHLWVQDVQNRVFSTLGQPNWLAAYIVALIFIPIALLKQTKNRFLSTSYLALSTVMFLTLLFTKSRSGLLAFGISSVVYWSFLFWKLKFGIFKNYLFIGYWILVIVTTLVVSNPLRDLAFSRLNLSPSNLALSTKLQGTSLETGGTQSTAIRKIVWSGAIKIWQASAKNFLIGTGPETFAMAYYQYRPIEHNNTSEWELLYNKAHNEFLNYLATTGILGLGAYLILLISMFMIFIKSYRSNPKINQLHNQLSNDHWQLIISALCAGWLTIPITNFWGFSVVIVQILMFILPAMAISLKQEDFKAGEFNPIKLSGSQIFSLLILLSAISYTLFAISRYWFADVKYATGRNQIQAFAQTQQPAYLLSAYQNLTAAVKLNHRDPPMTSDLALVTSYLSAVTYDTNATSSAQLAAAAVSLGQKAVSLSPHHPNYYKSLSRVAIVNATYFPQYLQIAADALKIAGKISPTDPRIPYNLGLVAEYANNMDLAKSYYQQALKLKPDFPDPQNKLDQIASQSPTKMSE